MLVNDRPTVEELEHLYTSRTRGMILARRE